MTVTRTAAGTIVPGSGPPADCTLTAPGVCHNFLMSAAAADSEWFKTTTSGQVNDGDLVIGINEASGPVRIHYQTAAQWRALALAANRIADWIEAVT